MFLEDVDGHALAELDQAEQEMLGADVVVVEAVGLLAGQGEHLLRARREVVHGSSWFGLSGVRRRRAAGDRLP